jgi:hypothetical protein
MSQPSSPLDSIADWIDGFPDQSQNLARVCARFAECANLADVTAFAELLAPDCIHESQTRWEPIHGRQAVSEYMLHLFKAEPRRAFAQLGAVTSDGLPCVLMCVRDSLFGRLGLGVLRSTITLGLDDHGQIKSTFARSLVPHPSSDRKSGLYPGLSEEDLQMQRTAMGLPLPLDAGLELLLFHLPELAEEIEPYREVVESVGANFGLPEVELYPLNSDDDFGPSLGAIAHPTVVLCHEGQRVRLIEGFASEEDLEQTFEEVFPNDLESGSLMDLEIDW